MNDLFMIPILLAVLAFGYYIMTRVDRVIEEDRRTIAEENRNGKSRVRIAAENPALLDAVASALESCSSADPHIDFFLSSGTAELLLEKLAAEQVDIVLLTGEREGLSGGDIVSIKIPCEKLPMVSVHGLPVEAAVAETGIRAVWKKSASSKDRDRVIFALENSYCRSEAGHRNAFDRQRTYPGRKNGRSVL